MHQIKALLIVLLAGLCLTACAVPAPVADPAAATTPVAETPAATTAALFPLTITDAAGQEFTFDAPPKIGCWWAGCMEILADLGVASHAGAYTDDNAGSAFFFPAGVPAYKIEDTNSPEQWAASEADIVLMRVPLTDDQQAVNNAVPIFYLHHPSYGESSQTGYQAFIENLHLVSQLIGQPAAADAAIARFATVLANMKALSTPETANQSVAVLFNGEGYSYIGAGSPFCLALIDVGLGHCVGEATTPGDFEANAEEFLNLNPDWIVYQIGAESYQARTDPIWAQLTAVKEGHVYDAQGHRYYCCSLRGLIHSLQEFAHYTLPAANIPLPGLWLDFDPLQSPLIQPAVSAALATTSTALSYTDAFSRTVELPVNPQRIIAHYYAADMVALGLPMVGTNFVNAELVLTPEQLQGLENIGEYEPNLEKIVTLKPDLIFVPDFMEANTVDRLSEIAPTVVMPYSGDPFARLRLFGEIVGKPEVADAWIDAYNAKAATQRAAVAGLIAPGETVTALIMYSDNELYVYGHPRLGLTLYDVFGFTQPPAVTELFKADPDALWQAISLELLPQYAGDRIFLVQADDETAQKATQALLDEPIWQALPAVQNDKLYLVDGRWALNDPLTLDWLLDEVATRLTE